jgi:hypothetical protein
MAGGDLPPFEDEEFVAPQQHPHVLTDETGRHRVVALPDGDSAAAVDLRRQGDAALELLQRQRRQLVGLGVEVEADGGQSACEDPFVLGRVDLGDLRVQLFQRGDLGNRNQVRAAETAALVLDPALLMGAVLARDAVKRRSRSEPGRTPTARTRCGCGRCRCGSPRA